MCLGAAKRFCDWVRRVSRGDMIEEGTVDVKTRSARYILFASLFAAAFATWTSLTVSSYDSPRVGAAEGLALGSAVWICGGKKSFRPTLSILLPMIVGFVCGVTSLVVHRAWILIPVNVIIFLTASFGSPNAGCLFLVVLIACSVFGGYAYSTASENWMYEFVTLFLLLSVSMHAAQQKLFEYFNGPENEK